MVAKLSSIQDPQESWRGSPAYPGFTGFWGSEGISFLSDFSVSGVFSSSSELIVLSLTLTSVSNKPKLSFLAFTLPSAWDPMCSSSFSLSLIGTILSSIQEPQDSSTGSPAYAELTVLVKVLLSEIPDFRRLMFSWSLISICVTVLFTFLLSSFWSPTILVFILSAIEKFRPSSGVKYLDSGWLSLSIFEVASSSSSSMVTKLSSIHDPQESWRGSPA